MGGHAAAPNLTNPMAVLIPSSGPPIVAGKPLFIFGDPTLLPFLKAGYVYQTHVADFVRVFRLQGDSSFYAESYLVTAFGWAYQIEEITLSNTAHTEYKTDLERPVFAFDWFANPQGTMPTKELLGIYQGLFVTEQPASLPPLAQGWSYSDRFDHFLTVRNLIGNHFVIGQGFCRIYPAVPPMRAGPDACPYVASVWHSAPFPLGISKPPPVRSRIRWSVLNPPARPSVRPTMHTLQNPLPEIPKPELDPTNVYDYDEDDDLPF